MVVSLNARVISSAQPTVNAIPRQPSTLPRFAFRIAVVTRLFLSLQESSLRVQFSTVLKLRTEQNEYDIGMMNPVVTDNRNQ